MNTREIKQIASECELISDFIRRFDSTTQGSNTIALVEAAGSHIRSRISVDLTRELWPSFRKLLVAKYDELAASINADKLDDPKSENSDGSRRR